MEHPITKWPRGLGQSGLFGGHFVLAAGGCVYETTKVRQCTCWIVSVSVVQDLFEYCSIVEINGIMQVLEIKLETKENGL